MSFFFWRGVIRQHLFLEHLLALTSFAAGDTSRRQTDGARPLHIRGINQLSTEAYCLFLLRVVALNKSDFVPRSHAV